MTRVQVQLQPTPLQSTPRRALRIALVNMPWARLTAPSIQCGILKAELVEAGHQVDVHYLNLDLAVELGFERYVGIGSVDSKRIHLLGEWLFSVAAFGDRADTDRYFEAFPELAQVVALFGDDLDGLRKLREHTLPGWVARCADSVSWADYDLIGFTSTFEQNVAAMALAAELKRRDARTAVVFGGANFDGEMGREYLRAIDWIDYAVLGEGDIALPALAAAIANGASPRGIPGVEVRDRDGVHHATPSTLMTNLARVPPPDYDDYFKTLAGLGRERVLGLRRTRLPAEFSRGCWWGEKHHCTFCGLNAAGMAFRSKPPEQALTELLALAEKYQVLRIDAVDNIIDMAYLGPLCAGLAERRLDLEMFFEVKANLNRSQLLALSRAGIRHIQPGLESLSTHVLDLMRKGTTMPLNVRLLKWAHHHGIKVSWNILTGFPGETDEDYYEQARLIPTLYHLQPPAGTTRLWLERYSPYFTDDSFPIRNVRPIPAYGYAYPVPGLDLNKIAYFFDYEADGVASTAAHQALADAVDTWKARWRDRRPELTFQRGPGFLRLRDSRRGELREQILSGWMADAYERCGDSPRTADRLAEEVRAAGFDVEPGEVVAFLADCVRRRLAVVEQGRYLTVAVPHRSAA